MKGNTVNMKNQKNDGNWAKWEEWIGSCALMNKNGKCAVKDAFMCSPNNMNCSFHKTAEEKEASEEVWKKRMNELPKAIQKYYAEEYHGGKMPWRTEKNSKTAECKEGNINTNGENEEFHNE